MRVRDLHERAVGDERVWIEPYERAASRDRAPQVAVDEKEVPAGLVRLLDDAALEGVAARKLEDVGDAAKPLVGLRLRVFLKADVLEDRAPLAQELRFEEELLRLDVRLVRVRDDRLGFGRAADERNGGNAAHDGLRAFKVLHVLVFRDDAVFRKDVYLAGGQLRGRLVRAFRHETRHEAPLEEPRTAIGLDERHRGFGAREPRRVGCGRRRLGLARRGLGALAVLCLDDDRRLVRPRRHVEVAVAQMDERRLVDEQAADALAFRAVEEGQHGGRHHLCVGIDLGVGIALLVVGVDIDDFDGLRTLDGQHAVVRLRGLLARAHRGDEVAVAASECDELGLLRVAGAALEPDKALFAERGEHGEVLVPDVREDALPGLDENRLVAARRLGHGGSHHLEGLGRAGPAPGFEVYLPDHEIGVVRERARRVVVREASENHDGLPALALREVQLALQQHRLGAELGALGLLCLPELGKRLVEDALFDVAATELQGRAETGLRRRIHALHGLEHADRALVLLLLEEIHRALDHSLRPGLGQLRGLGAGLGFLGGVCGGVCGRQGVAERGAQRRNCQHQCSFHRLVLQILTLLRSSLRRQSLLRDAQAPDGPGTIRPTSSIRDATGDGGRGLSPCPSRRPVRGTGPAL